MIRPKRVGSHENGGTVGTVFRKVGAFAKMCALIRARTWRSAAVTAVPGAWPRLVRTPSLAAGIANDGEIDGGYLMYAAPSYQEGVFLARKAR